MNLNSLIAFVIAGMVFTGAVISAGDPHRFLDWHALLVVIGGTIAAGAISFQVDRVFTLFRVFVRSVIKGSNVDYASIISEILDISELYRLRSPGLRNRVDNCKDSFLKEAMQLLLEDVLKGEQLLRVLRERVDTIFEDQMEEVSQFRAIGRYPPAFGLIGTTLSMITLLTKLGSPEGQKTIGPAMAIGLVATFYGLILANLVFNPVSENLARRTRANRTKNTIIVEGVALVLQQTNPIVLAEELNSFLIPSRRVDWRSLSGRAGSNPLPEKEESAA